MFWYVRGSSWSHFEHLSLKNPLDSVGVYSHVPFLHSVNVWHFRASKLKIFNRGCFFMYFAFFLYSFFFMCFLSVAFDMNLKCMFFSPPIRWGVSVGM